MELDHVYNTLLIQCYKMINTTAYLTNVIIPFYCYWSKNNETFYPIFIWKLKLSDSHSLPL